jgi:hypothetical protein
MDMEYWIFTMYLLVSNLGLMSSGTGVDKCNPILCVDDNQELYKI